MTKLQRPVLNSVKAVLFFNNDPDPAFHCGADPDPDPYQDPDPTPNLHILKNQNNIFDFHSQQWCQYRYIVLSFSSASQVT